MHESIPAPASVPVTESATGSAKNHQASRAAARAPALTAGGVESYWSANDPFAEFPALSVHVPLSVAPAESGPP